MLDDERDLPFLHLTAFLSVTILPAAVYLAWPGHFRWWLAVPYLVFYGYMLGPYILMLHNTSHRRFLVKKWEWLNFYIPVIIGPLFGESPYTYFAHHIGMHHPENNLPADHSSTMRFQRDSAWHFARYFGRFIFLGIMEITGYFLAKKRPRFARMLVVGELSYLAATIGCFFYDWRVCPRALRAADHHHPAGDDAGQLGAARLRRRGDAGQQLPEQHHLHQQRLQQALLQRRLPHRPSPEADPPLDGDAGGVPEQPGAATSRKAPSCSTRWTSRRCGFS